MKRKIKIDVEVIWDAVEMPKPLRTHCKTVKKSCGKVIETLEARGIYPDKEIVNYGALLHDVGRVIDGGVRQGLEGYNILLELGVPEEIALCARNHVGSGIPKEEAVEKGLPEEDFIPETLEQKIVAYGDNLVAFDKITNYSEFRASFVEKFGEVSTQVAMSDLLHSELTDFISRDEMLNIEKAAEIPVRQLMDNVGKEIAKIIDGKFSVEGKNIEIYCGPGNNGGDGYSAALYLKEKGANIEILSFGNPKSPESKDFKSLSLEKNINLALVLNSKDLATPEADIIIDCLLGTGLEGPVKEPIKSAISKINNSSAVIVSVDVPSGIGSKVHVNPDLTLALHKIKRKMVGFGKVGDTLILNMGIEN
ncbi:MAG: NAD(P)H-hydrate epimerase [archaeon]|nr:NAD(P)H-hydrate epimerase [archaeon]